MTDTNYLGWLTFHPAAELRGPHSLEDCEVVDEDEDDPWTAWVDCGGEG